MRILKYPALKIAIGILFLAKLSLSQVPNNDPAYELVWADSFNTSGVQVDTGKWAQKWPWNMSDSVVGTCNPTANVDCAFRKWHLTSGHPAGDYYIDTINCKKSGGILSLYSRKENFSGECWNWPLCNSSSDPQCTSNCGTQKPCTNNKCFRCDNKQFKYTAGMLLSKYKFKYGYFEIRFKLPPADTAFKLGPNFWLWASDGPSGPCPWSEIDVFEIKGNDRTRSTGYRYDNTVRTITDTTGGQHAIYPAMSADTWHTAGVLWTNEDIITYFDGQPVQNIWNTNIKPDSIISMYIIVDINSPAHNFCLRYNTNSTGTYQYQIDYVKVWQLKQDCNTDKTYCSSFNATTYDSKLYQTVAIGGSGCSDAITNNRKTSIYGKNYVLLNEGFSVDNDSSDSNAYVLMNTHKCDIIKTYAPVAPQPAPEAFTEKQKENLTE